MSRERLDWQGLLDEAGVEVPDDLQFSKGRDFLHLRPQQVFDASPAQTRERIDVKDFQAVLVVVMAFYRELRLRDLDSEMIPQLMSVLETRKE